MKILQEETEITEDSKDLEKKYINARYCLK